MLPHKALLAGVALAFIVLPDQAQADLILINPTGNLDVKIGDFEADESGLAFVGSALNESGGVSGGLLNVTTDFKGVVFGRGAAGIAANDSDASTRNDGFSSVMFAPSGASQGFEQFEFNSLGIGDFELIATNQFGTEFKIDLSLSQGQNRFRIGSTSGDLISKITLTALNPDSKMTSIRQVRVNESVEPGSARLSQAALTVPEPGSILLMLSGLASSLGFTLASRKRTA